MLLTYLLPPPSEYTHSKDTGFLTSTRMLLAQVPAGASNATFVNSSNIYSIGRDQYNVTNITTVSDSSLGAGEFQYIVSRRCAGGSRRPVFMVLAQ